MIGCRLDRSSDDAVAQPNGLNTLVLLGAMGTQVTKQQYKVQSLLIDVSAEQPPPQQQLQLPAC
jgi:hypothetical protein